MSAVPFAGVGKPFQKHAERHAAGALWFVALLFLAPAFTIILAALGLAYHLWLPSAPPRALCGSSRWSPPRTRPRSSRWSSHPQGRALVP